MHRIALLTVLLCATLVGACATDRATISVDDTPPAVPTIIEYGTGFGMCAGFCVSDLQIVGRDIQLDATNHTTTTVVTNRATLTGDGAAAIEAAAASVGDSPVEPVYGCPDCADGGATTLGLRLPGPGSEDGALVDVRTSYDWGRPPALLSSADDVGRALQEALSTCRSTELVTIVEPCTEVR